MAEFIGISDIIGQSELKRIQEEYCKISNVVTICLDDQLNIIHACGELTGITEDSDWSSQIMASEMIGELVDAVGGDSIEDVSFLRAEPEEMPEGLWLLPEIFQRVNLLTDSICSEIPAVRFIQEEYSR